MATWCCRRPRRDGASRSAAGAGLCALAVAGFVTILTEALPAGLLPQIGGSLGVSEAMAGQWISIYALGSLLAAIPLTAATRSWRRRPLLLGAIIGFAIANLMTALTASFIVAMAARFVGGASAGLLWALLAGYAVRMAPSRLAGRAMAIAMAGTPLALSIGIPAKLIAGEIELALGRSGALDATEDLIEIGKIGLHIAGAESESSENIWRFHQEPVSTLFVLV